MSTYRQSRNIEASIIQYIEDELSSGGWNNIVVEKAWARVVDAKIDPNSGKAIVYVHMSDTIHTPVEIGDISTYRNPLIIIDIFASSDGLRLDLKDFLVSKLKGGMPYYEYIINGNSIQSKTQNGRIRVNNFTDTKIDLGIDLADVDFKDRYRHRITLNTSLNKVEN